MLQTDRCFKKIQESDWIFCSQIIIDHYIIPKQTAWIIFAQICSCVLRRLLCFRRACYSNNVQKQHRISMTKNNKLYEHLLKKCRYRCWCSLWVRLSDGSKPGVCQVRGRQKVFVCLNTQGCLRQSLGITRKWLPVIGQESSIFVGRTMRSFRKRTQFVSALYH